MKRQAKMQKTQTHWTPEDIVHECVLPKEARRPANMERWGGSASGFIKSIGALWGPEEKTFIGLHKISASGKIMRATDG